VRLGDRAHSGNRSHLTQENTMTYSASDFMTDVTEALTNAGLLDTLGAHQVEDVGMWGEACVEAISRAGADFAILENERNLNTILAALSHWQQHLRDNDGLLPSDGADIATNYSEHEPLTADEIDDLRHLLNVTQGPVRVLDYYNKDDDDDLAIALPEGDSKSMPLYHQYPGQLRPQPAYLEMDEDGAVCVDWSGEIGNAMPMAQWHKRTLVWRIPETATAEALRAFLQDETTVALLKRVRAGHSVDWDGSNHVGKLTDDAEDASEELGRWCDHGGYFDAEDLGHVWDIDEWMTDCCTYEDAAGRPTRSEDDALAILVYIGDDGERVRIEPDTTDEQMREYEKRLQDAADARDDWNAWTRDDAVSDWLDERLQTVRRNAGLDGGH